MPSTVRARLADPRHCESVDLARVISHGSHAGNSDGVQHTMTLESEHLAFADRELQRGLTSAQERCVVH